jgi:hypothetical protein
MASEPARLQSAVETARTFCEARIPEDLREEIRLDVSRRGRSITIHELRSPWHPERSRPEWTSTRVAMSFRAAAGFIL